MKTTLDLRETTPRAPQAYATPIAPVRAAKLIWTGSSGLGSHAHRQMTGCLRAVGIQGPHFHAEPSPRDGRVEMMTEPTNNSLIMGPFTAQDAHGARGSSVYMIRGTLAHIALAHGLLQESLRRGEPVAVAGALIQGDPNDWYSPAEAIEAAAILVGTSSHKFALPAARNLLERLEHWVRGIVDRERVLAIESQLGWNLDAPWRYTARFDVLTQNRASALIYGTDYKTSANPKQDKSSRYPNSPQLMGQDAMGTRWAKERWGGVRVLLIEDKGATENVVVAPPEEWMFPRNAMTSAIEYGIAATQRTVVPYVGRHAIEWPTNPLYCPGCPAAVRSTCHALGARSAKAPGA